MYILYAIGFILFFKITLQQIVCSGDNNNKILANANQLYNANLTY